HSSLRGSRQDGDKKQESDGWNVLEHDVTSLSRFRKNRIRNLPPPSAGPLNNLERSRNVPVEFRGFRSPPPQQTRIHHASAMVPKVELRRSFRKLSRVNLLQQSGTPEAAGADIKCKIHQCIELGLRQLHPHRLVHRANR